MAWPHDTRLTTYAPLAPVKSADLNAIQDALIDLYEDGDIIQVPATAGWYQAGPNPAWAIKKANPEWGWECLGAIGEDHLLFDIPAGRSFHLLGVQIKYYNSLGVGAKPDIDVYLVDTNMALDASAPALGSSLADLSGATDIPPTSWGTRSTPLLAVTVTSGKRLMIIINTATTGDRVAGLNLIVRPIQLSP